MSVESLLSQAAQLPSIPKVVQELLTSFDDPTVDTATIASKIALDQALTAKVLRLANSSFYGGTRRIASAQDAVVFLGQDALRTLVLASGVTGAFKAPPGFDLNQFWRRSFIVAGLCKWLVRRGELKSRNPETAFTAGMLHDVGNLLLHTLEPGRMKIVDDAVAAGAPRGDSERQIFGCTSVEIGAELTRRWRFPDNLCRAVAEQIAPLTVREPNPYAILAHLGKSLYTLVIGKQPASAIAEVLDTAIVSALALDINKLQLHWPETAELGRDMEELLS